MPRALPSHWIAAGTGILALTAMTASAVAGGISVRVLDRDDAPVPEVAVYATALNASGGTGTVGTTGSGGGAGNGNACGAGPGSPATMNQRGRAFAPHVLIIETGTTVEFPNNDDVGHHVYSFSPARKLNMNIASGQVETPMNFSQPGVVTLGCNIHDDMLAYILVIDTPLFAKTDTDGTAELTGLAPGRYQLDIWTPRVASKNLPEPVIVDVSADGTTHRQHRFDAKLYPPHQHSDTSLHWAY